LCRTALASVVGILLLLAGCGSNSPPYNDTPAITNLFPSNATAGGPSLTMNIAGTGFIAQSVAYWNNASLPTTFNSTTLQLSVSVPTSDIANPGVAQVTVVTPSPGGGISNAATFTINPAQNPVPTITSLSPSSTQIGVLPPNGVLLVNGTNFIQTSTAAFNGISRTSTYVSSVQLSVPMSSSDVATNTTISVTVSNPAPGGGVSNALPFVVGSGSALRLKNSVIASGIQFPQLISVSALGGASNGQSSAPAVSADGRFVAFHSTATNLVSENAGNVFVRDTCLGVANCAPRTIAVDAAPDGSAPNAAAEAGVSISSDGRFVAFASSATNLLSAAVADASQANVYVRDLCVGLSAPSDCIPHTQLVSVNTAGNAGNGASSSLSISGDGRFIAFVSSADLVSGETTDQVNSGSGVFVRDTCTGATAASACVVKTYSATSSQSALRGDDFTGVVLSADGRYVAFVARNASAQTASQVLLADMCLGPGTTVACQPSLTKVSVSVDGSDLAGVNQSPSMSADGRFVVFESDVAGATPHIFLRDTCLDASAAGRCVSSTTLLSENASAPSISSAGRYVSYGFASGAAEGADGSSLGSLYVYDTCLAAASACHRQAYAITGASVVSAALPFSVEASVSAPMSSDGSFIVFSASPPSPEPPPNDKGDVLLSITPF
jgi:Tol biopolymer transport system component